MSLFPDLPPLPVKPERVVLPPILERSADFSACRSYRYSLTRRWKHHEPLLPFLMLNPSTADADIDDPTIRRCQGFALREGYAGVRILNLYAYRATKPSRLWEQQDPVGPGNDAAITNAAAYVTGAGAPWVLAWGENARPDRVERAIELLARCNSRLVCLGVNKSGQPRHPLYVRGDQPLEAWKP